jgi:hypothetical protein
MTKAFIGVLILAGLSGCATYYQVITIPDTAEALAAYRQCATAPHFSEVGACMAGIPSVTTTGWQDNNSQWKVEQGCRQILGGAYDTTNIWTWPFPSAHYRYSIQACPDGPPPTP